MRPLRLLASLSLTFAMLVQATPAGALAMNRVESISFSDPNKGWISGGHDPRTGFVSRTTDGGQTWRTTTDWDRWYYSVASDGDSGAWAFSNTEDRVKHSTDGGATWSETNRVLRSDQVDINGGMRLGSRFVVFGRNKGASFGQGAFIASTSDNGQSWSTQYQGPVYPAPNDYSDPPRTIADLVSGDSAAGGTTAYVAGNEWEQQAGSGGTSFIKYKRPLIFKTVNGGSTWTTQTVSASITGGNLIRSVAVGSSTVAFAGTSSTTLLRTINSGTTWSAVTLPRKANFSVGPSAKAVDAFGENILVVGGSNGFVAWTSNAGGSLVESDWKYFALPGKPNINAVQVLSTTSAIAVGDGETIARTDDAGNTWTLLPSGPPSANITGPASGFPLTAAPLKIVGQASDLGVGVAKVEVRIRRADGRSFNGAGWVTQDEWQEASSSDGWKTWEHVWTPDVALLASGQMVTVTARATDGVGQVSQSTGLTSGAPMAASALLAGGAPYTTTRFVTASISANGASHMRWRVGDGPYNNWQPFAPTATIELPAGDGTKDVTFNFSIDGTNIAAAASDSIHLHTTLPTVQVSAPTAGFNPSGQVNISGTASDVGGSVSSVRVLIRRSDGQSWNGSDWSSTDVWLPATGTTNWSYAWNAGSVGDHTVTIYARATDMANLTATSPGVTSAGPTSVLLDGGSPYTNTTSVNAAVSATGATFMRWRVNGGAYNTWRPFSSSVEVELTGGDGAKTVDFQFSTDGVNNNAGSASDSIVLHTVAPNVSISSPSADFPLSVAPVTFTGTASDGLGLASVEIMIRRANGDCWNGTDWVAGEQWLPTSGIGSWSYLWNAGEKAISGGMVTVTARATDIAGLKSTAAVTSAVPIQATAILAGGATHTASKTVQAAVSVQGMNWMRYRVNGSANTSWEAYSNSLDVALGDGDGQKDVVFEFSSDGSNIAASTSASIFLDATKPVVAVTKPSAGFSLTSPVLLSGTAADAGAGVDSVELSIRRGDEYWNGFAWQLSEFWFDAAPGGSAANRTWSYTWQVDSATSTGYLPVQVIARATDMVGNTGQSPQVTSYDRPDVTKTVLTSKSATLSYGGTGTIKGKITRLDAPFAGATVILQSGTSSTSLKDTTLKATSNADGVFTFKVKPSKKTYYRVRFAGTSALVKSTSTVIAYTPKVYLTTPSAPKTVRRNASFKSVGYIKPRHAAGSYPVRIYLYRKVGGSYKYYRYVKARATNYSTYTKVTATLKFPYKGTWQIRAYHSDASHATTYSSYRTVTVK